MPSRPSEVKISFHEDKRPNPEIHPRCLNIPENLSEISILMPAKIRVNAKRELLCSYRANPNANNLHIISDYHQYYDPMQYPLIFPDGRDGWNLTMPRNYNKMKGDKYASYYLMIRNSVPLSQIHMLNKLGKQ